MSENLTADYNALFTDRAHLPRSIETLREEYASSRPFPHLILDNLFAQCELDPLLSEAAAMDRDDWLRVEHDQRESFLRMRSAWHSSCGAPGRAGARPPWKKRTGNSPTRAAPRPSCRCATICARPCA